MSIFLFLNAKCFIIFFIINYKNSKVKCTLNSLTNKQTKTKAKAKPNNQTYHVHKITKHIFYAKIPNASNTKSLSALKSNANVENLIKTVYLHRYKA